MFANSVTWARIVLLAVGCFVRPSSLQDRMCQVKTSYQELRKVPYQELYTEKCWLFFTCDGSRTDYITEPYTAFKTRMTCCTSDKNENEKSQQQLSRYNCSMADCVDRVICHYSDRHDKCNSLCKDNNVKSFRPHDLCPPDYKLIDSNQRCLPQYDLECPNGWCGHPAGNCTCFDGNWKNGTKCSPVSRSCFHGKKASANECSCDYGWEGDFCDEPRLCVIAEVNGQGVVSEARNDTSEIKWNEFPACEQKCPDDLRGKAVNSTQFTPTITYHLIPTDSQCNATKTDQLFYVKHNNITAAVILAVITFLFGIISAACIIRSKRRTKVDKKDTMALSVTNVYIEENSIYGHCES